MSIFILFFFSNLAVRRGVLQTPMAADDAIKPGGDKSSFSLASGIKILSINV